MKQKAKEPVEPTVEGKGREGVHGRLSDDGRSHAAWEGKTIVQVGCRAKMVRVARLVGLPLLGPGARPGSLV